MHKVEKFGIATYHQWLLLTSYFLLVAAVCCFLHVRGVAFPKYETLICILSQGPFVYVICATQRRNYHSSNIDTPGFPLGLLLDISNLRKLKKNVFLQYTYIYTVYSHCLELSWVEFLSKSRALLCMNIYNLTPVESNSDESKFQLSRIKVLVPRCRKPYYLHTLSWIYLSKHVYYLGIRIGSQVKHPVIDFDIFTLGYFTCLFHNLSNWLVIIFELAWYYDTG